MTKKNSLYLKKAKLFYLYFFIAIFALFILLFYQNLSTKSAVNQFFKTSGLSKEDVLYKSVTKSLFGNSLIFYQVKFTSLSFANHIDKIVLKKEPEGYRISLTNANIDVIQSLRKTFNINVIDELSNYTPIEDILHKPIQTLALSNINTFTFNLDILLKKEKNLPIMKGVLTANNLLSIQFKTKFFKEHHSLNSKLHPIYIILEDKGIFKKYNQYLKSIDFNEILTQKELKWTNKNMPELIFAPTYQLQNFSENYF